MLGESAVGHVVEHSAIDLVLGATGKVFDLRSKDRVVVLHVIGPGVDGSIRRINVLSNLVRRARTKVSANFNLLCFRQSEIVLTNVDNSLSLRFFEKR